MAIYPPKKKNAERSVYSSIWHMDIRSIIGIRPNLRLVDVALFCRKISFLLDSGLSLRSALPILGEQMGNRNLADITRKLHSLLEQGFELSSAMHGVKVFPPFMCGYVEIGEKTGSLAEVFQKLADYYEEHAKIGNELTAALIYPLMVIVVMIGVVVLAFTMVLPGYEEIFTYSDVRMPVITTALISAASFVKENAVLLTMLFLVTNISLVIFLKTKTGSYFLASALLRSSLVKKAVNLKLSESIALLLGSKISVLEAVGICANIIGNEKVMHDLNKMEHSLKKGKPFWIALSEFSYVEPIFLEMVKIGEESGNLVATVAKCSHYLMSDYKISIKKLNKLVEPIITIALGAVLALIMLAVVLPTFELAQVM